MPLDTEYNSSGLTIRAFLPPGAVVPTVGLLQFAGHSKLVGGCTFNRSDGTMGVFEPEA
jgi:hypothetical protein